LLDQYQKKELGAPGEPAREAPLDELDATLETHEEKMAARAGIKHFLEASRQFLLDHPPQTHIMLAQGFGVTLAGGFDVALVPQTVEAPGALEQTDTYHVTQGRSVRGQQGVTSTEAVAVTGDQPEPFMRGPAT